MIVYIAGPVTSCMETYKATFERKAWELEQDGYTVINPALLPSTLPPESYMPICTAMIDAADAIYMMDGWEWSSGAKLELAYAQYQGKTVINP